MVDRIKLLHDLLAARGMNAGLQQAVNPLLDKALDAVVAGLGRKDVDALSPQVREALGHCVEQCVTPKTAMTVLKALETLAPQGKLAEPHACADLAALLRGERKTFAMPDTSLAIARRQRGAEPGAADIVIMRYVALKEAKALLVSWDKHNTARPTVDAEVRKALLALLSGTQEPAPAPLPPVNDLADARKADAATRALNVSWVEESASKAQAKALLKSWDKHDTTRPTVDAEVRKALLALLAGTQEPVAAPPPPPPPPVPVMPSRDLFAARKADAAMRAVNELWINKATAPELLDMLRTWDEHRSPQPNGVNNRRAALLALLSGAKEPEAAPPAPARPSGGRGGGGRGRRSASAGTS